MSLLDCRSHDRESTSIAPSTKRPSGRTDGPLTGLNTRRLRCRKRTTGTTVSSQSSARRRPCRGNFEGAAVSLVHHRGRKSGREYINPTMYLPDDADDDAIYVFATKAGARRIRIGTTTSPPPARAPRTRHETYPVTVRELQGDERDRIYDEQARRYPGFADYAKRTVGIRTIPVVELKRSSGHPPGRVAATHASSPAALAARNRPPAGDT